MREIVFTDWQKQRKERYSERLRIEKVRAPRRRPIPQDKAQVLFKIALAKKEKMISDGTITLVGPRTYVVRLSEIEKKKENNTSPML